MSQYKFANPENTGFMLIDENNMRWCMEWSVERSEPADLDTLLGQYWISDGRPMPDAYDGPPITPAL